MTWISRRKKEKHLEEFLQSLNDQISTLKSEINFLRGESKEKDHVIRILLNTRCKPSEDCCTTSYNNHLSLKSSDCSSNNNNRINSNVSRNKTNDISNNNISDNNNIDNNYNISNNDNKNNNNNDTISNIINNKNDNINNNISII